MRISLCWKGEIQKNTGDNLKEVSYVMENVKIAKSGAHFIIEEYTSKSSSVLKDAEETDPLFKEEKNPTVIVKFKVNSFTFNPNFEELKAFDLSFCCG